MNAPLEESIGRWLALARADIVEVRLNIQYGGAPHIACFHAQQAAEKALKALLVACGLDVPRIHDLDELRESLPDGLPVKTRFPRLGSLTVWAIAARYPGDWPEASVDDARQALDLAQALVGEAENDLKARGYEPEVEA